MVIHNWVSHDMFVVDSAKVGNPSVFGVFSSRKEAQKHIRPEADDYIQTFTLDKVAKKK